MLENYGYELLEHSVRLAHLEFCPNRNALERVLSCHPDSKNASLDYMPRANACASPSAAKKTANRAFFSRTTRPKSAHPSKILTHGCK